MKSRNLSILERKALYLSTVRPENRIKLLRRYYKKTGFYHRYRILKKLDKFAKLKLPLWLSFLRWLLIDALRGNLFNRRKFGIYQFVALPGEGKTMSMVAHIERYRNEFLQKGQPCYIATNFSYRHNDEFINHWTDMIRISKKCFTEHIPCLIAIDEVHITFDSADWKNFPAEILAMLSFNRKYGLEFLCSSQIYERIPKKIRDIANYTVICKNIGHFDRLFRCYYFKKSDYESQFEGRRKKADFIKEFIADDDFRNLYSTLEQVDTMTAKANEERTLQQKAFDILFNNGDTEA